MNNRYFSEGEREAVANTWITPRTWDWDLIKADVEMLAEAIGKLPQGANNLALMVTAKQLLGLLRMRDGGEMG